MISVYRLTLLVVCIAFAKRGSGTDPADNLSGFVPMVDEATLLKKTPPKFLQRSCATILQCDQSHAMARCPIATDTALLSVFQAPSLQGWYSRITSTAVPETLGRQSVLHLHAMGTNPTRGRQIAEDAPPCLSPLIWDLSKAIRAGRALKNFLK